jgi:hypothetical protein
MRPQRPPRPDDRPAPATSDDRGQTAIDFAVGATLFLLTMAFVFTFVPVMFQPFATSQSDPLVADRVANRLATDILGSPDEPYIIDETCTTAFFDDTGSPDCSYEFVSASLHPHLALGVQQKTNVNVTLVDSSGTVEEQIGDSRATARDVIIAQRRVLYDGESYELIVRVW